MTQKAPPVAASARRPMRRFVYAVVAAAVLIASYGVAPPVSAAGDCTVPATDTTPDSDEQALLTAINSYRQQNGVAALVSSTALNRSAAWQSKDMATRRSLNRTDSLGREPLTRMKDCGAAVTVAEENIAVGGVTAAATLDTWKASAAQNSALLSPVFKGAGVARFSDPATPSQTYWTLDLGDTADTGAATTTPAGTGSTTQTTSSGAQSGMGTVAVTVSLLGATGQTAQGSLSGYQFVLSGSGGGVYATPPTSNQGQTSLAVPAGTYTVTQQPKAGSTLVSISGGNGAGAGAAVTGAPVGGAVSSTVTVAAGMTATLTAVERVSGAVPATTATNPSTTIPAANPLANPLLTNPATNPLANPFLTNPGTNPLLNPALNPATNPILNPTANTVPAVPATGATTTTAATASTATESVALALGCNNVSITWPAGTPVSTVAAAVTGGLDAIWRWDSARNQYLGYSAIPGAPADYTTVGALYEPAFICVKGAGNISRPVGG